MIDKDLLQPLSAIVHTRSFGSFSSTESLTEIYEDGTSRLFDGIEEVGEIGEIRAEQRRKLFEGKRLEQVDNLPLFIVKDK